VGPDNYLCHQQNADVCVCDGVGVCRLAATAFCIQNADCVNGVCSNGTCN
jgi:hypothetical protein